MSVCTWICVYVCWGWCYGWCVVYMSAVACGVQKRAISLGLEFWGFLRGLPMLGTEYWSSARVVSHLTSELYLALSVSLSLLPSFLPCFFLPSLPSFCIFVVLSQYLGYEKMQSNKCYTFSSENRWERNETSSVSQNVFLSLSFPWLEWVTFAYITPLV